MTAHDELRDLANDIADLIATHQAHRASSQEIAEAVMRRIRPHLKTDAADALTSPGDTFWEDLRRDLDDPESRQALIHLVGVIRARDKARNNNSQDGTP